MTVVFYVVCCAAALTFAVACMARAVRYARSPVHLRWELYPVPHEKPDRAAYGGSYFEDSEFWRTPRRVNFVGELKFMIPEMLFLKALREFNRPLWFRSFPFHFGLYLLAATCGLLLAAALATVLTDHAAAGMFVSTLRGVSAVTGTVGIIMTVGGALALLHRRMTDPSLRPYNTLGDVLNLLFFAIALGIIGIGYVTRPAGSAGALAIAAGLLSWNTALRLPPLFGSGLAIGAVLSAYIPLTHMSHFIGKYFTYHAVRWDDRPLQDSRRMAAAMAAYLTYKPTWAASHIKGDDGATWADVVSRNPTRDVER